MKTLGVIVLNEFLDQVAQMSLAEYHVLVQTLVLDGSHKSLRIRIAIGTVRWDLHAPYTRRFENRVGGALPDRRGLVQSRFTGVLARRRSPR
jgi:hypothetical protein